MTNERAQKIFEKMKQLWAQLRKKDKCPDGLTQPDLFDGMDDPV